MRIYKPLTEEQKKQRSETMKGKPKSMVHRRNISIAMMTSPSTVRTPEWNANIGKSVSKTRRQQRPRIYIIGNIVFDKPVAKVYIKKTKSPEPTMPIIDTPIQPAVTEPISYSVTNTPATSYEQRKERMYDVYLETPVSTNPESNESSIEIDYNTEAMNLINSL